MAAALMGEQQRFVKPYSKGIRYKFLKGIFLILFTSTIALSTVIAIREETMLSRSLLAKGENMASYIAALSEEPLIEKDSVLLDSIVSKANKDEDIMSCIIHDEHGNAVTSQYAGINYKLSRLNAIIAGLPKESEIEDILAAIRNREAVMEVSAPILAGAYPIGKVSILLSQHNIRKQIVHTVIFVLALNVIVAVLLGVVVFIVSRRILFNPITELSRAIARFAKGDLSARVGIKATGEVGTLLEGFNRMAEDVEKTTVSKDYVDNILKSMTNSLIVVSPEHNIIRINAATCMLLGYEEEELIGRPVETIFGGSGPGKEPLTRIITTDSHVSNIEVTYLRKDDQEVPVLLSASAMHDANKATRGTVYVAQDITERKRAEESLQRAKEAAEAATIAKSRFLANMSHEIRTPMNGVLGMADLLLATSLTDKQRHFADTIQLSGKTLLNVINDILDFSKIEAGKVEFVRTGFSIRDVVEEVAEMLAARAQSKGIELVSLVRSDVPDKLVGDPDRLQQILLNLMGNAVKFTETGEIVVGVSLAEEIGNAARLHFEVTDTGSGVPPSAQETIFDSFSQADGSTKRKYGGTGLGLTISKQLVEMMGGRIGVRSEIGKGSTFWFTVLLDRQRLSGSPRPQRDLMGRHILVVDDNATNRTIVEHYLASWGMRCESAEDGTRALELLHRAREHNEPYDLAILDMMMPGMDGLDLARTIKADPAIADVPLVMLSSTGPSDSAFEARQADIAAYLTKPVRQSRLFDCLATVMSGVASRPLPEGPAPGKGQMIFPVDTLLVEDNPVNQEVGRAMLENLGCRVETASNGVEAVDAVSKRQHDIVFMDCQMPEMDGYEATRAIRDREKQESGGARRIPVIALTAHAMEGDRESCLAAGMDDYLSKPFNESQLRAILVQWMPPDRQTKRQSVSSAAEPKSEFPVADSPAGGNDGSPLDDRAVIDLTALNRISALQKDGQPSIVDKVVHMYLDSSATLLETMHNAVASGDAPVICSTAHTLKSASANLGALGFAELCKKMEAMGRSGTVSDSGLLLSDIEQEYHAVRAALTAEVKKGKAMVRS